MTERHSPYPQFLNLWWTSYHFDRAVTRYGLWVENKISERDDKGKARYTLEELLYDPKEVKRPRGSLRQSLRAAFGGKMTVRSGDS